MQTNMRIIKYLLLSLCLLSSFSIPKSEAQTLDFLVPNVVSYDADFQAVIDYANSNSITVPTSSNLTRLNTWVIAAKSDGTWAESDILYNFITGDSGERNRQFATLNYKSPSTHRWTISGTVSYDGNTGFWGDQTSGNSGYMVNDFVPNTHGVKFTLNNAGFGLYSFSNVQETTWLFGLSNTGGVAGLGTTGKSSSNILNYRINNNSTEGDYTNNTQRGNYHFYRTSSGTIVATKNGSQVDTGSQTSTSLSTTPIVLLGFSTAGTVTLKSNKNIAYFWMGSAQNSSVAAKNTTWSNFLTSMEPSILPPLSNAVIATDFASHCTFARSRFEYIASQNKTIFNQVHDGQDGNGYTQYIFQLDHSTGTITKFRIGDTNEFDDHNEASFIVRNSDNKYVAAFTDHNVPRLKFRISSNAYDISAWGSVITLTSTQVGNSDGAFTYPQIRQKSDGTLYCFFRDVDPVTFNGWAYIKSTDGGATWGNYLKFTGATGSGGINMTYAITAQDGDNIHFIQSDNGQSLVGNVIVHFYFNMTTETFHKTDGTDITSLIPITSTEPSVIASIASPQSAWIDDLIIDGSGNPRVVYCYYPGSVAGDELQVKKLMYSEWNGSAWTTPYEIHTALDGFIETTTGIKAAYGYPPWSSFDPADPDVIYTGKQVSGKIEIFKLERSAYNSFTSTQLTFNSLYDGWRPIKTAAPDRNLFWLNKQMYNYYNSTYHQQLINVTAP